jgi:hypothetical protein
VAAFIMDSAYLVLGAVVGAGWLYGIVASRRPKQGSKSGPYASLGLVGVLVAGLVVAGAPRNESLTWLFGLSLMVVGPLLLFLAIGKFIGSAMSGRRGERDS